MLEKRSLLSARSEADPISGRGIFKPLAPQSARTHRDNERRVLSKGKCTIALQLQLKNDFTSLVKRTIETFAACTHSPDEDAQIVLCSIRKQYDDAHVEAERIDRALARTRDQIKRFDCLADAQNHAKMRFENNQNALLKQLVANKNKTKEVTDNKKVLEHMLDRSKKDIFVMQQKVGNMEKHLQKKNTEYIEKVKEARRGRQESLYASKKTEALECEISLERSMREKAIKKMINSSQIKRNSIQRRVDFELWRQGIAQDAANEAFSAAAGKLRKLWALEKLTGNCLQKIIFDQGEKSQAIEKGFQTIREVTGLSDVLDIVQKFLTRDVERKQLISNVSHAESELEVLRQANERYKKQITALPHGEDFLTRVLHSESDMTWETGDISGVRELYAEVDSKEQELMRLVKESGFSKERLKKARLSIEQVRRWVYRVNGLFRGLEKKIEFDESNPYESLKVYFLSLDSTIEMFSNNVTQLLKNDSTPMYMSPHEDELNFKEQLCLQQENNFCRLGHRGKVFFTSEISKQKDDADTDDEFVSIRNLAAERKQHKSDSCNKINEGIRKRAKNGKSKVSKDINVNST